MTTEIQPAATVVLLRDTDRGLQVLLLKRNTRLQFAGGAWVFPGGRVDAEDQGDDELGRARTAAIRETLEEASMVLAADDLQFFSHWTAPEGTPRRFATWFFLAVQQHSAEVEVDGSEITEHRWVSPGAALMKHHAGEIHLLPPTFVTLTELARCTSATAAQQLYSNRGVEYFVPKVTELDEGLCMLYPGDAGYDRHDNSIDGDRHRFLMMPEGWSYVREFQGSAE